MSFHALTANPVDTALSGALDAAAAMIGEVLGPAGYGLITRSVAVATNGIDLDPLSGSFVLHSRRGVAVTYPDECNAYVTATVVSSYFLAPLQADTTASTRAALDLYIPVLRAHVANHQLGLAYVREYLVDDFDGEILTWGEGKDALRFWGFKALAHLALFVPLGADWHAE